jgi:ketosteroid isomerase-like protein
MASESENISTIREFYRALEVKDGARIMELLASEDLEWCFHGPPQEQHLMRQLTGAPSPSSSSSSPSSSSSSSSKPTSAPASEESEEFVFVPTYMECIENRVFVEGSGRRGGVHADKCWVHVWTIREDSRIAKLREYFNTSLTVLEQASVAAPCSTIWQSQLGSALHKSMPSLILAVYLCT